MFCKCCLDILGDPETCTEDKEANEEEKLKESSDLEDVVNAIAGNTLDIENSTLYHHTMIKSWSW